MSRFVYLVRHGQTAHSETKRFSGINDEPLTDSGRANVQRLGHWLSCEPRPAVVYTSSLHRGLQSGEGLAQSWGTPIPRQADPRLNESDFGEWEGLSGEELTAHYPEAFAAWLKDPTGFVPPGGESVVQLRERVLCCYRELLERHPAENLLLVSHGGPIRVILLDALGLPLQQFWKLNPPWASVSCLELTPALVRLLYMGQRVPVHPL